MKIPVYCIALVMGTIFLSCTNSPRQDNAPDEIAMQEIEIPQTTHAIHLNADFGSGELTINEPTLWNGQVWVYFHGSSGDVNSWKQFYRQVFSQLQGGTFQEAAGSTPSPIVIAVSFGPQWLLTPTEEGGQSEFATLVLPHIREYIPEQSSVTGIGYSMGGFNLLSAYADQPDFWDKLVFLNAALTTISPYAEKEAIAEYHRESFISLPQKLKHFLGMEDSYPIETIFKTQQKFIASDAQWQIANPLFRLQNSRVRQFELSQSVFISCGKNDAFGFILGSQQLEEMLNDTNVRIRTVYHDSGHVYVPYRDLGKFLLDE